MEMLILVIRFFLIITLVIFCNFSSLANQRLGVIYINSAHLKLMEGYALNVDASLSSNKVVFEKVKVVGRVEEVESIIKIANISHCEKYCSDELIEDESMRELKYYKSDMFHIKTFEMQTGASSENGHKETLFMGILFTKKQSVTVYDDKETIEKWVSDLNLILVRERNQSRLSYR